MPADRPIGTQIRSGLAWVGFASSLISILDIATTLIIPAVLGPTELGIAAAAIWLFPIFDLFVDAGLATAIIRGPEPTEERLSTVFWGNVTLSLVAGAVILVFARTFTGNAVAASILSIYAAKLVVHNVYFVPQALLRRELRFREISLVRIGANLANTFVKLGTAFAGAGAWSLLYGNLSHALVTAIGIQICRHWRPRWTFKFSTAIHDLRFGGLVAVREILFFFYSNVDYRVVIQFFGATANGVYKFAFELVLDPVRMISLIINEVALPTFAKLRETPASLIEQFITFARLNLVVVLPFVVWLAIEADDLISLIPGWHAYTGAVLTVRLLAGVGVLRALSFLIPPLLDALSRPKAALGYTVFASILLPGLYVGFAYVLGARLGYNAVALAWLVGYPFAFVLLLWLTLTSIELRARALLARTAGIIGCVAMGALAATATRLVLTAALPRIIVATVVFFAVLLALLSRFEKLGPRQIAAAIRGR